MKLFLQLQRLLILQIQVVLAVEKLDVAKDDIQPVVALFKRVQPVRQDGIDFRRLERRRLLEGQIGWPGQVIIKYIVVKLQLTVHLKELHLTVLQQSFFQLLHVDIGELLVHLGIINIDAIKAQIIQHLLVLVKQLVLVYVAFLPLQIFKVDQPGAEEARAGP